MTDIYETDLEVLLYATLHLPLLGWSCVDIHKNQFVISIDVFVIT